MTARGSSPTHEAPECPVCSMAVMESQWVCELCGERKAFDLPSLRREAAALALIDAGNDLPEYWTEAEAHRFREWLMGRAQALREGKD